MDLIIKSNTAGGRHFENNCSLFKQQNRQKIETGLFFDLLKKTIVLKQQISKFLHGL